MMEVKLDLAEPCARELRELIQEVLLVLLAREKPAVSRRPSIGVSKLAERGIPVGPRVDPFDANVDGSAAPKWLVVIAKCEQNVSGSARL